LDEISNEQDEMRQRVSIADSTVERETTDQTPDENNDVDLPPLRGLSILDRFLVIWILLAMAIGIILGNTVPSTGPALQKGTFVGVSIPIGKGPILSPASRA
jgi:arsenite transporter